MIFTGFEDDFVQIEKAAIEKSKLLELKCSNFPRIIPFRVRIIQNHSKMLSTIPWHQFEALKQFQTLPIAKLTLNVAPKMVRESNNSSKIINWLSILINE